MKITLHSGDLTREKCDLLVLNLFEGVKTPGGGTGAVDRALGGALSREIREAKFEGKEGEILLVSTAGKIPARKVLVIGLGKQEEFGLETVRRVAGFSVKRARAEKATKVATILHGAGSGQPKAALPARSQSELRGIGGLDPKEAAQALTEGALLASYQFLKYKTGDEIKRSRESKIRELVIVERDPSTKLGASRTKEKETREGIQQGELFAKSTSYARDLVNEPSEEAVPRRLADEARAIARKVRGVSVRVYNAAQMRRMKMGGALGVAQGSDDPPYFVHLSYQPVKNQKSKIKDQKIFLVGKGITFDSGGISLKPSEAMETMKMDMAGAAAVLAVFSVIDRIKPPVEVHGVFAACENMPSGKSIKPGDILRAMNGKTMEVINTDAEGRLTLADALSYAVKQKATTIIDLATLTGACIVALGDDIAALFVDNDKLRDTLFTAAKASGEKLWELPLEKSYKDHIKSRVADLKNLGKPRSAGAISAALFLEAFVGATPWAHIDIAGPAWQESDVHPYIIPGGTGFGVRTLLHYLLAISHKP